MAHLVLCRVHRHQNPAFVKVRCLGRGPGVDQHLRCFDAVCLGGKPVDPFAKADEHLFANLPAVKFGCGIRCPCAGQGLANLIDHFA